MLAKCKKWHAMEPMWCLRCQCVGRPTNQSRNSLARTVDAAPGIQWLTSAMSSYVSCLHLGRSQRSAWLSCLILVFLSVINATEGTVKSAMPPQTRAIQHSESVGEKKRKPVRRDPEKRRQQNIQAQRRYRKCGSHLESPHRRLASKSNY